MRRGAAPVTYTYAEMWEWALHWSAALLAHRPARGQAVVLALPNGDDFVGAYFGAMIAGLVPAPMAPLRTGVNQDVYLAQIRDRMAFIGATTLVVPEDQAAIGQRPPFSDLPHLAVMTKRDLPSHGSAPRFALGRHDLGLIQFTSGTSGHAKGVELTHESLLAQTAHISNVLRVDPEHDSAVSFLPLFHDMGLIGYLLTPLFNGAHVTVLRTEDFAASPSVWVQAISEYGATITGGPPSAYAICARHVRAADVGKYDLRRLRAALVGAEMITPTSLQQFIERFEPAGFRPASLVPTYGLAESGLAVSMTPLGRGPELDLVDLETLQTSGYAERVSERNCRPVRQFVSVGVPLERTEIAITDHAGQRLAERHVGQILVSSATLMKGYHRQPDASQSALRDGWLWTGDLGYLAGRRLYVTGRLKEILIVGGRNYYPEDLEEVARQVPGVRAGRAVAISVFDASVSTESVIVFAETAFAERAERDTLAQRIRVALVQAGYPVRLVVLLRPKTIQVTESGKLRRLDCKARYLAGDLACWPDGTHNGGDA